MRAGSSPTPRGASSSAPCSTARSGSTGWRRAGTRSSSSRRHGGGRPPAPLDTPEATDALVASLRASAEAAASNPFASRAASEAARGSALRAVELRAGDRDLELLLLRVECNLVGVDAIRAEARPRADALL